jgi:hypothetical protein
MSARLARLERDPLARAGSGPDDATDLVAEHERLGDARARAAIDIPVEVGAAQPDRGHAQQLLARRGHGVGELLEPQVGDRVESQRIHRR